MGGIRQYGTYVPYPPKNKGFWPSVEDLVTPYSINRNSNQVSFLVLSDMEKKLGRVFGKLDTINRTFRETPLID